MMGSPAVGMPDASSTTNITAAESSPGIPVFPNEPNSPHVSRILVEHTSDSGYEACVGTTTDRRWYAWYGDGAETKVFATPQETAAWLWRQGKCDFGVLQALQELGWLKLDPKGLNKAARTHGSHGAAGSQRQGGRASRHLPAAPGKAVMAPPEKHTGAAAPVLAEKGKKGTLVAGTPNVTKNRIAAAASVGGIKTEGSAARPATVAKVVGNGGGTKK